MAQGCGAEFDLRLLVGRRSCSWVTKNCETIFVGCISWAFGRRLGIHVGLGVLGLISLADLVDNLGRIQKWYFLLVLLGLCDVGLHELGVRELFRCRRSCEL